MKEHRKFLIWGAGGHAQVVADLVRSLGHQVVGHIALDGVGEQAEPGGAKVLLGQDEMLELLEDRSRPELPHGADAIVVAFGNNEARLEFVVKIADDLCPPLVHPAAVVSPSVTLGAGSVVFPNAVINADAQIGEAVIVNTGAIVEHDCVVGAGVHVSPNASVCGESRVGELSWVGAGSTVIHCVSVGRSTTVGAGAVVIDDVPDGVTVVGNPARVIQGGEGP